MAECAVSKERIQELAVSVMANALETGSPSIDYLRHVITLAANEGAAAREKTGSAAPAKPQRHLGPDEPDPDKLQDWVENVEYLLKKTPRAVRVRYKGGPENLLASLVLNYSALLQDAHSPKKGASN